MSLLLALALSLGAPPPTWDGPSRLREAASQVTPRLIEGGDLSALDGAGALLWVDPVRLKDPAPILRAVRGGARALLLVEADGPLLAALGLGVAPAPEAASPLHPALFPVTLTGASAALRVEGGPLLANHAVTLTGGEGLRPAATLQGGRPFAYHLALGRGEIIVCGDSSLFINLMLTHPPNAAALSGLLGWLTEGGARPLHLLSGGIEVLPAPPQRESRRARLNALLGRLNRAPLPAWLVEGLTGLLAVAVALAALLRLRAPRSAPRPRSESTAASRREA